VNWVLSREHLHWNHSKRITPKNYNHNNKWAHLMNSYACWNLSIVVPKKDVCFFLNFNEIFSISNMNYSSFIALKFQPCLWLGSSSGTSLALQLHLPSKRITSSVVVAPLGKIIDKCKHIWIGKHIGSPTYLLVTQIIVIREKGLFS
jgi:hypothetical protein